MDLSLVYFFNLNFVALSLSTYFLSESRVSKTQAKRNFTIYPFLIEGNHTTILISYQYTA